MKPEKYIKRYALKHKNDDRYYYLIEAMKNHGK